MGPALLGSSLSSNNQVLKSSNITRDIHTTRNLLYHVNSVRVRRSCSRTGHRWTDQGRGASLGRRIPFPLVRRAVEGKIATNSDLQQKSGVHDGRYLVSEQDVHLFHQQGFVHLPSVLTEPELEEVIDPVYHDFLQGKIKVPGKDLCDMSGARDRTPDQFTVYNVMLPRTYYPAWQGSTFERRCKDIADQLQGGSMAPDYDQILAKRPRSQDAVFAWHQDMAYWPPFTAETATATCWLAVSDATRENGCMRFVPGSHQEAALRSHAPVGKTREESHALKTELYDTDVVVEVPIKRGDITVHNERVVHGSGPNLSDGWRKAYVLAFRKEACIAEERSLGFTHSHNDTFNWDVFHAHQKV